MFIYFLWGAGWCFIDTASKKTETSKLYKNDKIKTFETRIYDTFNKLFEKLQFIDSELIYEFLDCWDTLSLRYWVFRFSWQSRRSQIFSIGRLVRILRSPIISLHALHSVVCFGSLNFSSHGGEVVVFYYKERLHAL